MKILVAVDGSDFSKKMLAWMGLHDTVFGSGHEYTLINVQTALPGRVKRLLDKDTVQSYYTDASEKVLGAAAKFLQRHGLRTTNSARIGHAAEVIANMAEEGDYDLLVMGTHGTGALLKLVMGSVATEVLAHCKVPVLLVR